MARMLFENDELIEKLDSLARRVPAKIPEALEAMADVLEPALISAAPYDGSRKHKEKHLREVIKRTNVRPATGEISPNGKHLTIFVSPRGIRGATQGKRARKNWDKDKHVFKVVVAEYGSSKQPANPFWRQTIDKNADKILEAGAELLLSEVDKYGD